MAPTDVDARLVDARLEDCGGPRWSRRLVDFTALGFMVLAWLHGTHGGGALSAFLFAWSAPLPILGWWLTRNAPRDVKLRVRPGAVEVTGAGLLNQTIRVKDVRASSSACASGTYVLSLDVAHHRSHPVTFRVKTRAELEQIHQALGISASDAGVLGFPVTRRVSGAVFLGFRVFLGVLFALGARAALHEGASEMASGIGVLFFYSCWACFARPSGTSDLAFTQAGLFLQGKLAHRFVPWTSVWSAELVGNELVLHLPERQAIKTTFWGRAPTASRRAELETLVAQVGGVIDRVRGKTEPRREVNDALFSLRRAPGESTTAWFARLDGLGASASMRGGAGYRGVSLDLEEVGRVLQDVDADVEIRTAAARLLARSESPAKMRVRLEPVLATARHQKVRVALERAADADLGEAAEAYDAAVGEPSRFEARRAR